MKVERFFKPRQPGLDRWVLGYYFSEVDAGNDVLIESLGIQPHLFLQFVLEGEQRLRHLTRGVSVVTPHCAVFGPTEQHLFDREIIGRLRTFSIILQPGVAAPFFGLEACSLVSSYCPLPEANSLRSDLTGSASFDRMITLAERWLAVRALVAAPPEPVALAAARLSKQGGRTPVAHLADEVGLSVRQFQRSFKRAVGVAPKTFARLCRLFNAILLHERKPSQSWTEIAYETGFADQSHFIREFRELLAITPCEFRRFALV